MDRRKYGACLAFLAVGAVLSAVYFAIPRGAGRNGLYDAMSFAAVVAIWVGLRIHRPRLRWPWHLFAIGQILFTVGDLVWDYYELVRHVDAPFPGVADYFYLAGYPFFAVGLLLFVRHRDPGRDRGSVIDATIIATGLALLSWVFLMVPYADDPTLTLYSKVLSIAYPLMDVLLIAVLARLVVGPGQRTAAFRLLSASFAVMLVADIAYAEMALSGTYTDGHVVDLGWLLSFVLLGAAALHPAMGEVATPAATRTKLTKRRLILLAGASLLAPAALAVESFRSGEDSDLVIAIGSAAMFLLVLVRMLGLVRDVESTVDELALQGARLKEAEARYRSVVEHIPAVTYVQEVDEDQEWWQTTYISPQVESLLGYTPEEWMRDRPWATMLHPDDRKRILAANLRQHNTGEPFREIYRLIAKDGHEVWVHGEAILLRDGAGSPHVWQGVMFDVTGHKLAEQALRHALGREREAAGRLRALDQLKTTFLHAVSHELRTPLAAILGSAITLERRDIQLSAEDAHDLTRRLAANARKLDRLLGDLLDLDRLDRGIVEPKRRATDVRAMLRRVVEESALLGDHPVQVDAGSLVVEVDPAKVERIVENLLVNTVRHTDPGTPVWVRAEGHPDGVTIVVEDAGKGVSADQARTIFEPFRRGAAEGSATPGVGIGLSLVARFAELHGGRAWVEDRPGGGASFRAFLRGRPVPLSEVEPAVASTAS